MAGVRFNEQHTGIVWDDMVWADEGGVQLLMRNDGDKLVIKIQQPNGTSAQATIASFRRKRIASMCALEEGHIDV